MISKRKFWRFFLSISLGLSLFPFCKAITLPFNPTPISPFQEAYWAVNIGDIYRWNVTAYNGTNLLVTLDLSYKINGTVLITNFDDIQYHCLQVQSMIYNESEGVFEINPLVSILGNLSLINFTLSKMLASQYDEPVTYFIPKLGDSLMTEWCANASYIQYKGLFDPAEPPGIFFNHNTIRFYNNTSGDFIELVYCNDGSLKSCNKYITYKGLTGFDEYIVNVTRLYPSCQEVPNPTPEIPTISFGNIFLLFFVIGAAGLLVYVLKTKFN